MYLDVEEWKDHPVVPAELHHEMLGIAERLAHVPVGYDHGMFSERELTPIRLKALWEHENAGRLWSYHYDKPGVLYVHPHRELDEWRLIATTTGEAVVPSEPEKNATPSRNVNSAVWDQRATACFIQHQGWTKKRIAEEIGCHEKQLCPKRAPFLTAAMAAAKSGNAPPSGSKSADGQLEASNDW